MTGTAMAKLIGGCSDAKLPFHIQYLVHLHVICERPDLYLVSICSHLECLTNDRARQIEETSLPCLGDDHGLLLFHAKGEEIFSNVLGGCIVSHRSSEEVKERLDGWAQTSLVDVVFFAKLRQACREVLCSLCHVKQDRYQFCEHLLAECIDLLDVCEELFIWLLRHKVEGAHARRSRKCLSSSKLLSNLDIVQDFGVIIVSKVAVD